MRIKTADPGPFGESGRPPIERGRWTRRLAGGCEVTIDRAAGFLLVDSRSDELIGEFPDTRALFVEALARLASGTPVDALRMDVRSISGQTGPGAEGATLVDLAQSALGIAGKRRSPATEA